MKRKIWFLYKIIIFLIIIVAILTTILSYNVDDRGLNHIYNYYFVVLDYNKNSDLVIVKDVSLDKVSTKESIIYISSDNDEWKIKSGEVDKIINTKTGSKIFSIYESTSKKVENVDSSCIIGTELITIPFLGVYFKYLLLRDGFLILIVLPLLIMYIYYLFKFVDNLSRKEKD